MVKIQDYYVAADFMILDMGEEGKDVPIILGRPFLNTMNAFIYIGSRQVHFQFPREKVRCYFNSYTTYEQPKKTRSRRRRRSYRNQNNQSLKKSWEEDEEPEKPTPPKSSPQTKTGMKRKGDITYLLSSIA